MYALSFSDCCSFVLDTAIAINTAMFEQNGQSGYVLKPAVTWDKSHVMYNHFNPLDKEFDGLHTTVLTLHVCFFNMIQFQDKNYICFHFCVIVKMFT